MANDSLLKEVRRLIKVEIDKGQVWQKLDTLLGDNIKEAVLDSEIKVKRQELEVIKRETQTEKDKAKADREKREASLAADKVKFDKEVAEQAEVSEEALDKLRVLAKEHADVERVAIRNSEQKIGRIQKVCDEEMARIREETAQGKLAVVKEVNDLMALRDSMKEEIRAMQNKYLGVRV